ncbi:MAG: ArsA family ATPase [Acidobacteriota bacterium]|nr:MAG: ArsA family ATPase [Acidobacteriota bacterium]
MSFPLSSARHPLIVVVGSGGVGKTTVAASLGLLSAEAGRDTLVMTFDPSHRLKDALGVGSSVGDAEVPVPVEMPAELDASLLDAAHTFDRLVSQYAPDERSRQRILENRFYKHLAGHLAGILEYMAVERLFEVDRAGRYQRVILDTPPTSQALDFLEAPDRIIRFLDSGALRLGMRSWFDEHGHLRATARLGALGRRIERMLDRAAGLGLLHEMLDFFQAFGPLYAGFRERAEQVKKLLASERTLFVLVCGAAQERIPDTLFFARRLLEAGYRLGPLIVNRVHPLLRAERRAASGSVGRKLMAWLGERDQRGIEHLRGLLGAGQQLIPVPECPDEPNGIAGLSMIGAHLRRESATS